MVDSANVVLARGAQETYQTAISADNTQELAVLDAARNPKVVWQGTYDENINAPSNSEDGIETEDVLYAVLILQLRLDSSTLRKLVTVNSILNNHVYRTTIDDINCDYTSDGSATLQEILDGVAGAINTTMGTVVTASVEDLNGDLTDDTVVVTSDTSENFTIAVVSELDIAGDASSATAKLWGRFKDDADPPNRPWFDLDGVAQTFDNNSASRINVAGLSAIFVQLSEINGTVKAGLAPCGVTVQDEADWS